MQKVQCYQYDAYNFQNALESDFCRNLNAHARVFFSVTNIREILISCGGEMRAVLSFRKSIQYLRYLKTARGKLSRVLKVSKTFTKKCLKFTKFHFGPAFPPNGNRCSRHFIAKACVILMFMYAVLHVTFH